MLESALAGVSAAMAWPSIGYMVLGVLLGLYFGAVPGLSGITGLAILLPFTFGMDPVVAFAFLLGMYAVTTTADSLPAILIGVPGTASAQATILEGYPLAKRGEANRALAVAFICAAIGGVIGAAVMGLSIPILRPIVMSFAKPEFFMLCVLALTMIASLSGTSILKGLIGAAVGLLLSMVGYAEQHAEPRFWMGIHTLLEGIPIVTLVLGFFAFPEVAMLAVRNRPISRVAELGPQSGSKQAIRDIVTHRWLMFRSAILGSYVGVLPGVGGSVADWIGYGHAVQSAKDKSQFGKGDIRGLIAPETASNAVKGGDLIPTVAFGIPGSSAMAILLGAFMIQGLTPGPQMLTLHLPLTFSMVTTLVAANILGAALMLMWSRQLQKIIFLPGRLVLPAIMAFLLMGAWTSGASISDWVLLVIFGALGIIFKWGGWPRPPVVLGFVLGGIMENALYLSVRAYDMTWVTRPFVMALGAGVALALFFAIRTSIRNRRESLLAEAGSGQQVDAHSGEPMDVRVSLLLCAGLGLLFVIAITQAVQWPSAMSLFPLAIIIPALALTIIASAFDLRKWRAYGGPSKNVDDSPLALLPGTVRFTGWIAAIIVTTILVGQLVALPLFVFLYLKFEARRGIIFSAVYAALLGAFLYVTFEKVVGIIWYPSMFLRM